MGQISGRYGGLSVVWSIGLLLACGQWGCSGNNGGGDTAEVEFGESGEALTPQDAAINAKWVKLGGLAAVGQATSVVTTLPLGLQGQYQTFTNGVVVSSDDFGAVYLTHSIFSKWLSLQLQVDGGGNSLLQIVGLPVDDFAALGAGTASTFQGGQVITSASGDYVTYGQSRRRSHGCIRR